MNKGYVWDFPTSKSLITRLSSIKKEYNKLSIEVAFINAGDFPGRIYSQQSMEKLKVHASLELEIEEIENKLKKFS